MMRAPGNQAVGIFQIAVLVLSVYALVALVIDLVAPLNAETSKLIQIFDYVVCAVFFADFINQMVRADDKWKYLRVGWIDLLASIPTIDLLRWGRLVRVVRILRVLRAIRGTQKLFQIFRERKAIGGTVGLTAFMLILVCSLSVLAVETDPRSNIKTAGDALWWSLTTATTVGYGDLYPVTGIGRLIAVILMVGGVGLFGSLTALIASYFTSKETEESPAPLIEELKALHLELAALRQQIERKKEQAE